MKSRRHFASNMYIRNNVSRDFLVDSYRHCRAAIDTQYTIHACNARRGWCLRERESLEARRYMHTAKNGLRAKERSCEFIARAPLFVRCAHANARVHVNLRPASRSHESVLSSSSSDSRPTVDDASSRASRSESSFSLSRSPIPSSARPSSPPVPPPLRFSLSLFHSSSPNKRWIQLNRRSRSSRSSHTENRHISLLAWQIE